MKLVGKIAVIYILRLALEMDIEGFVIQLLIKVEDQKMSNIRKTDYKQFSLAYKL